MWQHIVFKGYTLGATAAEGGCAHASEIRTSGRAIIVQGENGCRGHRRHHRSRTGHHGITDRSHGRTTAF